MINELKDLMRGIGIEDSVVDETGPDQRLAGVMKSADYPAFIVAVEERYGVSVSDRYSLKLRSLNDFMDFIKAQ